MPSVIFFYHLGFKEGVVADCQDWLFKTKDEIEIKVSTCDKKIFNWEIEGISGKHSLEKLLQISKKLGLNPLTEQEIENYWKWMKRNANRPLDIKKIEAWYKTYLKTTRGHYVYVES